MTPYYSDNYDYLNQEQLQSELERKGLPLSSSRIECLNSLRLQDVVEKKIPLLFMEEGPWLLRLYFGRIVLCLESIHLHCYSRLSVNKQSHDCQDVPGFDGFLLREVREDERTISFFDPSASQIFFHRFGEDWPKGSLRRRFIKGKAEMVTSITEEELRWRAVQKGIQNVASLSREEIEIKLLNALEYESEEDILAAIRNFPISSIEVGTHLPYVWISFVDYPKKLAFLLLVESSCESRLRFFPEKKEEHLVGKKIIEISNSHLSSGKKMVISLEENGESVSPLIVEATWNYDSAFFQVRLI